ncbi:NUDIX hydrolase [Brevibacillus sp. NRS-1366]|uniref:NUDIX hydrolase n=1 Tax=Brevibacillus sp. NRS-1366 TaxID=3233899 RepID=UPI003D1F1A28
MIRKEFPAGLFNHRIVGVAIHEGQVLLHRKVTDDFWALPGGRAELMEPSAQTIQREFAEELGVEVSVNRLLFVVENFFDFEGVPHHELSFYYLVTIEGTPSLFDQEREHVGIEQDVALVFRWFPVDSLEEIPLYPTFLRSALRLLPTAIEHIVHYD